MNKRNRNRLLWFASRLARWAAGLRRYVKRVTPKRQRTKRQLENDEREQQFEADRHDEFMKSQL